MIDKAYAKINLVLDVTGKERKDGYHDLDMIMAPLHLHDDVEMILSDEDCLYIDGNKVDEPDHNTVFMALKAFKKHYPVNDHFIFHLTKRIPSQAGLAGGSADGASVIRLLQRCYGNPLSDDQALEAAAEVGSDVPFCYMNKLARVQGRGEIVLPFKGKTDFMVYLVKPDEGVSTKEAFHNINNVYHPDVQGMQEGLIHGDYDQIIHSLGNSLEESSMAVCPAIKDVHQKMKEIGFDGVLMSGSGSTVFGLTRDPRIIDTADDVFQDIFHRSTKILEVEDE